MSLEKLNLNRCSQLTGKPTCAWGGSVKVLPQGNTRSVRRTFLKMTNPSPLPQRSTGDISVLQNMALTILDLTLCTKLTGTLPPYIPGTEVLEAKACCPRATLNRTPGTFLNNDNPLPLSNRQVISRRCRACCSLISTCGTRTSSPVSASTGYMGKNCVASGQHGGIEEPSSPVLMGRPFPPHLPGPTR